MKVEKQVITQVVLTPKHENVSWEMNQDTEDLVWGLGDPYRTYGVGPRLWSFSDMDWELRAEVGPSKKYAELIERLGEDAANEAWEVLFG